MHISHDFIATKSCPSYEFLVVFGQVRVWDRKCAEGQKYPGIPGLCHQFENIVWNVTFCT